MFNEVPSAAADAVMTAEHPRHDEGGPCDECAFRSGTEANRTEHTVTLARLCVEGFRPFYCHVHPGLCRGYVAALNLRGVPEDEDDRRWCEVARMAADVLGECIESARAADAVARGSGDGTD
jgi:hypothetical protein